MHPIPLIFACILPLIYFASCNTRLPDDPPPAKAEGSPPNSADLDNLSEQLDSSLLSDEEDPEKRGWHKLSNVWGKRGDWNKLNNMWGKRGDWNKLNNMWGKRGDWNKLNNMWGKRGDWNKLNNMWGKRESSNELPPYWGKRGWNNLSNVWGKRGWNNLSNVWGKRTASRDDGSKRTTQWNNLKSVWGKRDAGWDGPEIWEAIPNEDSFQGIYVPDQM